MQPASRTWRQTDVEINPHNLCPTFWSSERPLEESTCRYHFLSTWDLSVIFTVCSSLPTNFLYSEVLPVSSPQISSTIWLIIVNIEVLPVSGSQISSTVWLMRLCGCWSVLSTVLWKPRLFYCSLVAIILYFLKLFSSSTSMSFSPATFP